jgi:molybdopterin-guanine dinucleotide biosynthesis protein A
MPCFDDFSRVQKAGLTPDIGGGSRFDRRCAKRQEPGMSQLPLHAAGMILAGGLARRMGGGDKPLVAIGGRAMLERVIERLAPQVGRLAINANGDPGRFAAYRLPVIADTIGGFAGPLAGILAGLRWARAHGGGARFLISVAGDTPFFPADLVERLSAPAGDDDDTIAIAASAGGAHPVFGRWPLALADELEAFLTSGAGGKILAFVERFRRIDVHFDDVRLTTGQVIDPFFNVNTPEEALRAEEIAAFMPNAP